MTKIHLEDDPSTPDFRLNRRGDGFSLSWRGAAAAIGFIALCVVGWLSLRQDIAAQSVDLVAVKAEIRELRADVSRQEKILTRLDLKMGMTPAAGGATAATWRQ